MVKPRKLTIVMASLLALAAIFFGICLGWGLSETINIKNTEYITEFELALPTKLLDINGEVITEFASDERREIIAIGDVPQHMIDALLIREDRVFYAHHGYSVRAVLRAIYGVLTRRSLGGGSTLTQHIAGTLYADLSDRSVFRKIRELWWAIQMERRHSKNEIMELYLNRIYLGGGTYGVDAASKYYFGHGATEITPAEAALLVIQLSNPAYYNPFNHPNRARERQGGVLDAMVEAGYITRAEADRSFDDYWAQFDYTRTSTSAYFMRDDKAPWFSEYVRRQLAGMIYGSQDIYTGGFTVHTTLNLAHQEAAEVVMARYIARANRLYQRDASVHLASAYRTYIPISELLAVLFNLPGIKVSEQRAESLSQAAFVKTVNPILDVCALMFGMDSLKIDVINRANIISRENSARTTIEGTMIALENDTGYITALVGGSHYDESNQYIRAVQANLQPGSTFKPLYYSAAIDTHDFTAATTISDTPVVFHRADGKPYIPQNFRGEFKGNVQLWYALAHSMNVPSLKILDAIGFDAAIKRALALLGIPAAEVPSRGFVPGYPLGLGVCSVKPIEIARSFAIFANGGRAVTPIAIRTVEDRNGNIIENPELAVRREQQAQGGSAQVISAPTAFVMTKLLQNTTRSGTLAWGLSRESSNVSGAGSTKMTYRTAEGRAYTIPSAGKTGTTQNWADAWTVGYSPYYTSAFWFGFDRRGKSLGLNITGSTLAGVAWGDFMGMIHDGLPPRDFAEPLSGVVAATVCSESGLLPTAECGSHVIKHWFLEGTVPVTSCTFHTNTTAATISYSRLKNEMYQSGQHLTQSYDTTPLSLNLDFLNATSLDYFDKDTTAAEHDKEPEHDPEEAIPEFNYLLE